MLTFDTLKFSIPLDLINSYNEKSYDFVRQTGENFLVKQLKHTLSNPIYGLKMICIDKIKKLVIIELSAKILGNSYIQNITPFSFIQLLEQIGNSKFIKFSNTAVLKFLKFYRVDVSKNIILQDDIEKYIQSLSYVVNSKKYNYQTYKNEAVTFSYNPLSKRRRLRFIFYDKFKELKHDKNFCRLFDVNRFINVLRFEINLNNYFLMRRYLQLPEKAELNFHNVIDSDVNVFKNVYLQLLNLNPQTTEVLEMTESKEKLSDLEKNFGRIQICKNFNYDFKLVSTFLRNHVKGNIQRYYKSYAEICSNCQCKKQYQINNNLLTKIYKYVA
jgi:hypothetical protein